MMANFAYCRAVRYSCPVTRGQQAMGGPDFRRCEAPDLLPASIGVVDAGGGVREDPSLGAHDAGIGRLELPRHRANPRPRVGRHRTESGLQGPEPIVAPDREKPALGGLPRDRDQQVLAPNATPIDLEHPIPRRDPPHRRHRAADTSNRRPTLRKRA